MAIVKEHVLEFVIVLVVLATISWVIELGLHRLVKYFKHHQQYHLVELINKLSQELMVLGLVSLIVFIVTNELNFGEEDTERFEIEHLEVFILAISPILGISCVLAAASVLKRRIRNPKSKVYQWHREKFLAVYGLDSTFDYLYHLDQSYKLGVVRLGNFNIVMWLIFAVVTLVEGLEIKVAGDWIGVIVNVMVVVVSALSFTVLRRVFASKLDRFSRASYQAEEAPTVVKATESVPLINSGEPQHGSSAKFEVGSIKELKRYVIWLTRLGRLVLFWFSLDTFVSLLLICLTEFDVYQMLYALLRTAVYTWIYLAFYNHLYFAWAYLINPHIRNCYKYADSH